MASISVPAAIAIGAGVSGAAGLASSALSSGAASSAAGQQAAAANNAAAAQTNQQNFTNGQLAPFVGAGQGATSRLADITGVNGVGASTNALSQYGIPSLTYQTPNALSSVLSNPTFNPTQAQLAATPGYQFDLAQGEQGVASSNAAQGRGISGAALKGAANYATGLANNTLTTQQGIFQNNYSNALQSNSQGQGIFQSNLTNVLGPLQNLANLSENAAAQNGQIGQNSAANIGGDIVGAGNAAAAGTVGSANALSGGLTSGLNSAGSSPLNYLLYNQLLGGGGADNNTYDLTTQANTFSPRVADAGY